MCLHVRWELVQPFLICIYELKPVKIDHFRIFALSHLDSKLHLVIVTTSGLSKLN